MNARADLVFALGPIKSAVSISHQLFLGTYDSRLSFGVNRHLREDCLEFRFFTVSASVKFSPINYRGSHDEISAMVYPVCSVLAAGVAGTGDLPSRLAYSSTVQDYRDNGKWNSGIDRFDHKASGPCARQNMILQANTESVP